MRQKRQLKVSEASVLNAVMDYLDLKRISYVRVNPTRITGRQGKITFCRVRPSQKGVADIISLDMNGVGIAIECKSSMGKPSQDQIDFQQGWEKRGGIYKIARSLDDIIHLFEFDAVIPERL